MKQYGCQIYVTQGFETIHDVEEEVNFRVWYLYLAGEQILIDKPFTNEQEDKIIGTFLRWLCQSEDDVSNNYFQ